MVHAPYIQIDTRIELGRPQQEVFDYVTNPTLWHTWHPATVEVRHAPKRPLTTGETALEYIEVYGRRDQVLWTVVSCVAPEHWGMVRVNYLGRPAEIIVAHQGYCCRCANCNCFHYISVHAKRTGMLFSPYATVSLKTLAMAAFRHDSSPLVTRPPIGPRASEPQTYF